MTWTLLEILWDILRDVYELWSQPLPEKVNCLIPGCNKPAGANYSRGLCITCYSRAKRLVDSGETTWEQLVSRGLAKPLTDPFDDAYSRAMEDT